MAYKSVEHHDAISVHSQISHIIEISTNSFNARYDDGRKLKAIMTQHYASPLHMVLIQVYKP